MRLTIVSQWFPPEQAPFGRMMLELAEFHVKKGWEVTVITGFPNHPGGTVFPGYRKRWVAEERVNGVRVLRVWLWTGANRGMLMRLLTFLSFTLTSAWRLLRDRRPDAVFAVLQPLSVGLTLGAVAGLRGLPIVYNIQDLHPDTQIRLGMVRNRWLIRLLRAIERRAYRHGDALTVICPPFREHVIANGADPAKTHVIENWIDTQRIAPTYDGAPIRALAGLPAQAVVALWAGTLGRVSGASMIVDVAIRVRELAPDVHILVVGEGPLRADLAQAVESQGLEHVRLLPFQPEASVGAVQCAGDIALVTLDPAFGDSSVPSKVLAYLSAGRPVIAAVPENSPTARMLRESGAAAVVPYGDVVAFADALVALAHDGPRRAQWSARARDYAMRTFSREAALPRYSRVFESVAR